MVPLANQRSLFAETTASEAIRFFAAGTPQPRGSKTPMPLYRGGVLQFDEQGKPIIRVVDSCRLSGKWMNQIRDAAKKAVGPNHILWDGPVSVEAEFRFKRPRAHYTGNWELRRDAPLRHEQVPDCDKLQRALGDALTHTIIVDDRQIWLWVNPRKVWTGTQAGVEVTVRRAP